MFPVLTAARSRDTAWGAELHLAESYIHGGAGHHGYDQRRALHCTACDVLMCGGYRALNALHDASVCALREVADLYICRQNMRKSIYLDINPIISRAALEFGISTGRARMFRLIGMEVD